MKFMTAQLHHEALIVNLLGGKEKEDDEDYGLIIKTTVVWVNIISRNDVYEKLVF